MKLGVQMDPIETISIRGDTTFALMLEAQHRGHSLFVFQPTDVLYANGSVHAHVREIEVHDDDKSHFLVRTTCKVPLMDMDIILVRQDPPFDTAYLANTFLLELLSEKVVMCNSPRAIRNFAEKLRVLDLHRFMPDTFIGRQRSDIRQFSALFEQVVIKPLFLGGGASIVKTSIHDENFESYLDLMLARVGKEPVIVQQFIPEVVEGDKRVFVIDGTIAGVLRRIPPKGDFRANIHVGGAPQLDRLELNELKICEQVISVLNSEGIMFAGIDLIFGRLNEVNVTSPTLVREYLEVSGIDLAKQIIDLLERRVEGRSSPK